MKAAQLTFDSGAPVRLGERIGRGGEGEVHALAEDKARAVKVYTLADLATRRDKVRAMVAAGLAASSDLVAFPDAVVNRGGQFAGFSMRRVTGYKPLHELYAPGARKMAFPQANYGFLVKSATNVARALGAVHVTGCVIGDVNHSGILVSPRATVALIDADSFQFTANGQRHACLVGVPEYTPPELQGVALGTVERTEAHDAFGLAVALFQLLFMGRHPFSGAFSGGEMPLEKAIAEHRFVYSRQRTTGMRPPPAVPTLADFPTPIAAAFEAAFAPRGTRPDARQWVALLGGLERDLRVCSRSSLHHHASAAPECPWCRMESRLGAILFMPKASPSAATAEIADPGAAGFNLATAWARIEAVPRPGNAPTEPQFAPLDASTMATARSGRRARQGRQALGLGALLAAVAVVVTAAALWPAWVALAWFGLAKLLSDSPATSAMRKERADIERRYSAALAEWRKRVGGDAFQSRLADLATARKAYLGLADLERRKIEDYRNNRRNEQLAAYLDSFLLRRQKIRGVGGQRLAMLASYGIETALDVAHHRIAAVPGFGPKTAASIVAWRDTVTARFVYNPAVNATDTAKAAAIRKEVVDISARLRRELLAGPATLIAERAAAEAARMKPDPRLLALHLRRSEITATLS